MIIIPDIHDAEAFRGRLKPHLYKLYVCRTFMRFDACWVGEEARELHDLIEAMAIYLDGEAIDRKARLRSRIDSLNGIQSADHAKDIRQSSESWLSISETTLDILMQGTAPGFRAVFDAVCVEALEFLIYEMERGCFDRLETEIQELEFEIEMLLEG